MEPSGFARSLSQTPSNKGISRQSMLFKDSSPLSHLFKTKLFDHGQTADFGAIQIAIHIGYPGETENIFRTVLVTGFDAMNSLVAKRLFVPKNIPARFLSSSAVDDASKVCCSRKFPMGQQVEQGKTYYWCSCGRSAKQPFCDGSHKGTNFKPVEYKPEKSGSVKFCMCKSTNKQPLCDFSHLRVLIPFIGTKVNTGGLYVRREWEKK